jgi:hypothetical protein
MAGPGYASSKLQALRPAQRVQYVPETRPNPEGTGYASSVRGMTRSSSETADTVELVHRLLAASLAAWHVDGRVGREADRLTVTAGNETFLIARGAPPFRWTVTLAGRVRGVTSIAGLLRTVRRVVDPDHQPSQLRIAPSSLVSP